MIAQNSIMDFFLKTPASSNERNRVREAGRNGLDQFDSIFKSSLDQAKSKDAASKNSDFERKSKNDDKGANRKEQIKSFREATQVNGRGIQKSKDNRDAFRNFDNSGDDQAVKKEDKDENARLNTAVMIFTQTIDIDYDEFIKVLSMSDINPEDFASNETIDKNTDKLGVVFGLANEEKEVLKAVLSEVAVYQNKHIEDLEQLTNTSGSASNKTDVDNSMGIKGSSELIKADTAMEDTNIKSTILPEITAKVKFMLEEIVSKSGISSADPANDISDRVKASMESMFQQGQLRAAANNRVKLSEEHDQKEQALIDEIVLTEEQTNNRVLVNTDTAANNSKDSGTKNPFADIMEEVMNNEGTADKAEMVNDKSNNYSGMSVNQFHKDIAVAKANKANPVPRNEIVNQIVEKAKIVLGGEKSEMIMELKPESLGKLSLKVVTERGMVVAKFIAESQQVKEVLEANMQLLKESLEKQGLSVQGFSVSVGQDSSQRFDRHELRSNMQKEKDKVDIVSTGMVNASGIIQEQQKLNPYAWSDSKINLTA